MSILNKLSSSSGRRDEILNKQLAKELAARKDKKAIKELVDNLQNKSKDIQSDCIKVIYEIAETNPALIAPYSKELITLLSDKNNRLQWGAMTALKMITELDPDIIYAALPKIISVADSGSVITNDHCVCILIKFCKIKKHGASAFSLLNERLLKSPTNQLPMYAENALPIISEKTKDTFRKTLLSRLDDIEKESKRKRLEKVLKKLDKN